MSAALRYFVAFFGIVCCIIALAHIMVGPDAIPGSVPVNATMDSEDRFYATLFLGFGAALVWASGDLAGRERIFGALLLVFFAGGLSRLVSLAVVGPPHPLFQVLTGVELLLPMILWWWHRAERASSRTPQVKAQG